MDGTPSVTGRGSEVRVWRGGSRACGLGEVGWSSWGIYGGGTRKDGRGRERTSGYGESWRCRRFVYVPRCSVNENRVQACGELLGLALCSKCVRLAVSRMRFPEQN